MADVERSGGAGHRDVNHHVALVEQPVAQAVALVAYDECYILGERCVIDAGGVIGGFDGDDFFAFWYDLMQVGLLAEIPTDVITA